MGKRNPVLYIDDAESNLLVAKVSLNDIGIPMHCAKSAKEGISNSQAEAYSLILCDIQLPDATGFEVLRAIRSTRGINQFSPVVAFTADIKFFLAWGQHDYESARRQLHHLELLVSNLKLEAMKKLIDDLRTEKAITKQSSLAAVKLHRHLLYLMENFS